MAYALTAAPAYTDRPGTRILKDGVVFSSVFRDCAACGLILYHLPDLEEIRIPFTDEYRYGSLYSVKICGLLPAEWGYRYYRDEISFEDPYARELMQVALHGKKVTLSRLYPHPEDSLPAYGSKKRRDWSERILYCVHVQGFTASRSSHSAARGTFRGLAEKASYLGKLGINGVELMPVYELRPRLPERILPKKEGQEDAAAAAQETKDNEAAAKPNYWNFGEGCYFAPKKEYAATDSPQEEFKSMVDTLHQNGIEVFLQLYFTENVSIQTQLETARFYVTHYQIDGFHLKGNASALQTIASDPMLSDTALFYYDFPYEDLKREDRENPTVGRPSVHHLCEYNENFQTLARRFVKSDNQVLREFVKLFVTVPCGHGSVHYVTNYEGFTLMDLVSYNWKHNEANGEENRDGCDNNWSWNCGVEGPSHKKDIRTLRNRQMRNLMALNLLAQGTPLLLSGDERCNSQGGNNNPYCQNNETGWMNWKDTVDSKAMLSFTQKLIAFRKEHGIFRRKHPFGFNDPKAIGYPDISFHGSEAWKPDLSGYSHTVGILLPEAYDEENPRDSFLYLAINMHWHSQLLALPRLPEGYFWRVVMDTFSEDPFRPENEQPQDPRSISCGGRSVQILLAERMPEKRQLPHATVGIRRKTEKK